MYDALKLTSNMIELMNEKKYELTNMKLQKLLYYFAVEYYKKYRKMAFLQDIEKTKYGPIIRNVWLAYPQTRWRRIHEPLYEIVFDEHYGFVKSYLVEREALSNEVHNLLNQVVELYGNQSVIDLTRLTMNESIWKKDRSSIFKKNKTVIYTESDFEELIFQG